MDEAVPFVEWGVQGGPQMHSSAGTLTFSRNSMCGKHFLLVQTVHHNLIVISQIQSIRKLVQYKVANIFAYVLMTI